MRSGGAIALLIGWLLFGSAAAVAADSALDAETLVRQTWYEGIPSSETRRFDARAVAHLGAMLREPSLAEHHANIVLALGMSGHPHAFALLDEYARRPLSGEVDRATFRARSRLALAMGHLARSDRRALRWLVQRAEQPAAPPAWRFRHQRGDRLALLLDEQVLTGLALSGADEADALLSRRADAARGAGPADQRLLRHVEQGRRTHRRVKEGDVDAPLGERSR